MKRADVQSAVIRYLLMKNHTLSTTYNTQKEQTTERIVSALTIIEPINLNENELLLFRFAHLHVD